VEIVRDRVEIELRNAFFCTSCRRGDINGFERSNPGKLEVSRDKYLYEIQP